MSSVAVVSRQMGVPIRGEFRRLTATLNFDPASPAGGRAGITIDVASFDLGDDEFNRELQRPEWFDAETHPLATFETTTITAADDGDLQAAGRLTIKGRTLAVIAAIRHHQEGGHEVFEGMLPIRRLQFNIGSGAWSDTSVVADEVEILFRLVAAKP